MIAYNQTNRTASLRRNVFAKVRIPMIPFDLADVLVPAALVGGALANIVAMLAILGVL